MWFTTLSADALFDMVHAVIVLDMMLAECVRKRGRLLTMILPDFYLDIPHNITV